MSENLPIPTNPGDINVADLIIQDNFIYQKSVPTNAGYVLTAADTAGNVIWSPTGGGGGPTFSDALFRVTNSVDATKQLAFSCVSITAATTVTYTVPKHNGILPCKPVSRTLATGDASYLVTGQDNTIYGVQAGRTLTTGVANILIGTQAGELLTTGNGNILISSAYLLCNPNDSNMINLGGFVSLGSGTTCIGIEFVRNAIQSNLLYYNSTTGEVSSSTGSFGAAAPTLSNTAIGASSLGTLNVVAANALRNTAYGALSASATTDNVGNTDNTIIGYAASQSIPISSQNTVLGSLALSSVATPIGAITGNVAIGYQALKSVAAPTVLTNNVAIGSNALFASTAGTDNVAIGSSAMIAATTCVSTVAIGTGALQNNITGNNNVAIGYQAFNTATGVANSVAIGYQALSTTETAINNTAVGASSLKVDSTGLSNTAVGYATLFSNTIGNYNTALGASSLYTNIIGNSNVAVGYLALNLCTGSENTAVGSSALLNCTASYNTCMGSGAGIALTSGSGNTAIGTYTMTNLTTATGCVAIGYQAMAGTADAAIITHAVAVGFRALYLLRGVNNYSIGIGSFAGSNITTASGSICIGRETGNAITTSSWIVAIGYQSFATTTVGTNVGLGYSAGRDLTSGGNNVAIGYQSLLGAVDSTAANSTAVGSNSLFAVSSGADNTAVGLSAGIAVSTGSNNVILGSTTAATLTTGANNIIIGKSTNVDAAARTNSIIIGNATRNVPAADNSITLGFNSAQTTAYTSCYIDGISGATSATGIAVLINSSGQLGTTTSSQRFKDNIYTIDQPLIDRMYQLRPVSFTYNNVIEEEKSITQYGLIAEEVLDVLPEMVIMEREPDASGIIHPHTVQYHKLYALLLAAIKQLKARCDALEARV